AIEVAAMAAVFIRVGSFTGKVQTQIEGLAEKHDTLVTRMGTEHERIIEDLNREVAQIERSHARIREDQRQNSVRLYERWEKVAERVASVEATVRSIAASDARLRNGS
ncbi:MAG: hypothetical protein ACREJT_00260, partial [Myxococcota bacterium]